MVPELVKSASAAMDEALVLITTVRITVTSNKAGLATVMKISCQPGFD
jgi:hypothetical protein